MNLEHLGGQFLVIIVALNIRYQWEFNNNGKDSSNISYFFLSLVQWFALLSLFFLTIDCLLYCKIIKKK